MKLNPYLHFNGNCEEALSFYVQALGAKPVMLLRYSESPEPDRVTREMGPKIMHGRILLGQDAIMASDAPPDRVQPAAGFALSISVDSTEEAERLFAALSEKAEICMPMGETFWAHRFGMLIDQFGISWMINFEKQG